MAIEDLHWVDKSTEDALKYFWRASRRKNITDLYLRPEFVHTWGRKSYHNQLTLNRLSNRESLAMAKNLLGTEQCGQGDRGADPVQRRKGYRSSSRSISKSLKDLKIIERQNGAYKRHQGRQNHHDPFHHPGCHHGPGGSFAGRGKEDHCEPALSSKGNSVMSC